MKKYNTSLKLLFEEEMLSDGFSRLSQTRLGSDRPDVCKLDIPRSLVRFLLVSKDTGREKVVSILGQIEKEGIKGAIPAVFSAFGEFLESFVAGIVDDPEYYQSAQELLSLTLSDVPATYCKFFNLITKKIDKILQVSGFYAAPDPTANNTEEVDVDFSIFKELSESGKNLLEKIRIQSNDYDQLSIVKNHSFIIRNIDFKYGYAHFENFLKHYVTSAEFDANKLEEDMQKFVEIIDDIKASPTNDGVGGVYEYASNSEILDYNELPFFDSMLEKYQTFDEENDDDEGSGQSAKSIVLKEYASFLLVVIRKMFYDKDIKSMISSNEFKLKLAEIERLLTSNGGNENYFATN